MATESTPGEPDKATLADAVREKRRLLEAEVERLNDLSQKRIQQEPRPIGPEPDPR